MKKNGNKKGWAAKRSLRRPSGLFKRIYPFDVVVDAKSCFRRRQVGSPDLLIQMHLDIIHALLHRAAELGIGAAFVYPADKIIVHHQPQRIQIVQGFGGFHGLDVTVAQSVGFFGGKSALRWPHGRPGR